jgi:molecular chaperone HscB
MLPIPKSGAAAMNLQSTDFEIFDVPARFAQDRAALDAKWKELQREAHPDKFAARGAAAQRVAMQWSVRINEAYQRLKDPLKRASYLCELNGAPINAENNTAMPTDFLMQQMAWREALDDADTVEKMDEIALESNDYVRKQLLKIEHLLDDKQDYQGAANQVRSLMFVERFASEVETRIEQLGQ